MDLQYYFSGDFSKFEEIFKSIEHQRHRFKRKEELTSVGQAMPEMFYILSGTMTSSYLHASGHCKAFAFYGKGYLAPLYYPGDSETERSVAFTAVSDMEVLSFNRYKFEELLFNNRELNRAMYKAFNDLAGLLVLDNANQLFCTGLEKISNFLYIYRENINDDVIELTQNDIMDLVGINLKNVSKYLKVLREAGVIETRRSRIIVLDRQKLRQFCTAEIIY